MSKIAMILLLSGSLSAQSPTLPEHPLVLTIIGVQASKSATGMTTHVIGVLSEESWKQSVELSCNVGLSSSGPDGKANTYPARWGYNQRANWPKSVMIYVREPGEPSMRDYKCVARPLQQPDRTR